MVAVFRCFGFLFLIISGFTLLRPRSGWGRLALFIPKLFAGTFISVIGVMGFTVAVLGWFFAHDLLSLLLGFISTAISGSYIFEVARRSLLVGKRIEASHPVQPTSKRIAYPWAGVRQEHLDITWKRDVPIGHHAQTGEVILADLWQPATLEKCSGLGILYLHGSGWHYADKDFGTRHFFRHLARQGHLVADLAYTLAPKADLYGMVADIKLAVRWMKEHASELGIHTDRIVLMGGSAGGHLALLAGYTPNHATLDPAGAGDTSVCGVVSYYGPPDLRAQFDRFCELPGLTGKSKIERRFMAYLEARFGFEPLPVHNLLPEFLGGTPQEVPELYELGSPITHVGQHCPPTLLLQGAHDFSGAAPEVRKLESALGAAGCSVFLLELPGTEHGFDLYKPKWSPAAQAATYTTDRFLTALASKG